MVVFMASASCASGSDQGRAQPKLPSVTLGITRGGLPVTKLLAEVADSDIERERGLMFRKDLADGAGMLFVFPSDQRLAFWMKNTQLPLSIAWIESNGTISEILDMTPFSLASVESSRFVRYALEVPQGWFARSGVQVGDRVVIPETQRVPADSR
jgi:uncharacterized membrane protein (UPF0127 family)